MADGVLDRAGDVREGEALDVAAVVDWLKAEGVDVAWRPEVRQFSGGASNLTYLLRWPERELILRRPPPGRKAKGAHDMAREFRIQRALAPVFDVVPPMVALCEDEAVLGADFYVMERLRGVIPRRNLPRGLDLSPDQVRRLCVGFLDRLVDLHAVDVDAAGLTWIGKGEGYVERQISGWCRRYERARTWNVPRWRSVMRWLRDHQPEDADTVVIHNDYRLDNVVLDPDDPTRIVGVLDWELATLGCPLMDLGNTLAYWVEPGDDRLMQSVRRQPTHLPGMLTRAEVVAHYAERTGRSLEDFRFYRVYGLFRLAGIIQQIYQRYHLGQTTNPAFRNFWVFNHYLRYRAWRAMRGTD